MANFHSDSWIRSKLLDHFNDAKAMYPESQIVGVFLQGSQNYGLDVEGSDIDTKCILVPSFKDIALNRKPVSTTHIRENNEHIDLKDIRLYMETFRKQNLNFLEILFTPYFIVNPLYINEWIRLVDNREAIAHMNPYRAVKSMKGIALEKYHAMEHRYPSKVDVIDKMGYDPKQLHHLARVDNYLTRYIAGDTYENCLIPDEKTSKFLIDIKNGWLDLAAARTLAGICLEHVTKIADKFCEETKEEENKEMRALLEDVQYNIMKIAIKLEMEDK
jgi:hypothetical protein